MFFWGVIAIYSNLHKVKEVKMPGKIVYVLVLLLLFSCEEVEKNFNYIEVTITGEATVVKMEDNVLLLDHGIAGEPVEMTLVKAGGERVDDTGITGTEGQTSITAKFNLYKEQPIEFIAKPVNYPDKIQSIKFTWDEAESIAISAEGKPRTASKTLHLYFGIPIAN